MKSYFILFIIGTLTSLLHAQTYDIKIEEIVKKIQENLPHKKTLKPLLIIVKVLNIQYLMLLKKNWPK